jgi:translation elongation factor EF-G
MAGGGDSDYYRMSFALFFNKMDRMFQKLRAKNMMKHRLDNTIHISPCEN